jgi:hypothetical protein
MVNTVVGVQNGDWKPGLAKFKSKQHSDENRA